MPLFLTHCRLPWTAVLNLDKNNYGGQILEPQLQKKGLKTLSVIRILARDGVYSQRTLKLGLEQVSPLLLSFNDLLIWLRCY